MKITNCLNLVLFLLVLIFCFSCEMPDTDGDDTDQDDGTTDASLTVSIEDGVGTIDVDESVTLKAVAVDSEDRSVSIEWYVDDVLQSGRSENEFAFSSSSEGSYNIKVKAVCEEDNATDSVDITVEQILYFSKTASFAPDPAGGDPTYTAVFSDGTNILLGTQFDGVIYSKDNGSNWDYLNNADDELSSDQIYCVTADPSSTAIWYFGTFDGLSVYDSSASSMNTYETGSSIQVEDILIEGSDIYMATGSGLAVSDKTNMIFTYYDTSNGLPADSINSIYIDGAVIYAATESGFAYAATGALSSWTVIDSGDGIGSDSVADVYADGTTIIAWTSSDISVSSDGGVNWNSLSAVSGGQTGTAVIDGIIHSVGYGSHLVSSIDSGAAWQDIELPDAPSWFGYNNNDLCTDGSQLYIVHNDGLLIGTVD